MRSGRCQRGLPMSGFTEVFAADSAFRQEAASVPFDPKTEARALRSLLEGASAASLELKKACVAKGCEPRLDRVFETWGKWREAEDDAIGFAVQKVVRELEADHLRPLSIVKRLESGVTLACFGALTLMDQLSLHAPPSSDI